MATKATIRQSRYDKSHTKTYCLKMNLATDSDIIKKLSSVPSMQGYIKQLIRQDIARTCSVPKAKKEGRKMKTYHIKPEYLDMWEGGDTPSNPDLVITEEQVKEFSKEWGKPVPELLAQLVEID